MTTPTIQRTGHDTADPVHVIVVINEDGDEALYVGGDFVCADGPTVYACDIAEAVGDKVIKFSHVNVGEFADEWPKRFEDLMPAIAKANQP